MLKNKIKTDNIHAHIYMFQTKLKLVHVLFCVIKEKYITNVCKWFISVLTI
jgi:hypothetical protein